ncbi:EscE/YscE/SsaE family type III secretion system needle protein co-chaperone [Sinorhizobium sp. 7-81]|uniref:EscE/YscE/SsaE family type III secretion system needle protein co-chaperone n=1 Tax=Sinorhizobium sp. 8-89 TaxID=3049089 RepID=UPI0024C3DAC6|nr:EscE/YscE/SsaE family type III secretion system needle protein co-chaperone [Sinorhizobium sp. 8-89]MDK1492993.1 EscE/YscE/SsaE family type III secretion system needle protein co-chaperone [Sinorhizobium sp. 8-89]
MSEDLVMFDLQRQLFNDVDGTYRSAVDTELEKWRESLKREMDVGVPRQAFEVLSAIADSITAAREVVDTTWMRYHANQFQSGRR